MTPPLPKRVVIDLIDHAEQSYETVGNYSTLADGTLHIVVSRTPTPLYSWFIAVHELIEAILAANAGIADEEITEFDKRWLEQARTKPMWADEPGNDPLAPYHRIHVIAGICERIMVEQADAHWTHYEDELAALLDPKEA